MAYHSPWFIVIFHRIALHFIFCLVLYCFVVQCSIVCLIFFWFLASGYKFSETESVRQWLKWEGALEEGLSPHLSLLAPYLSVYLLHIKPVYCAKQYEKYTGMHHFNRRNLKIPNPQTQTTPPFVATGSTIARQQLSPSTQPLADRFKHCCGVQEDEYNERKILALLCIAITNFYRAAWNADAV